jgi:hypothetical protein
MRSLRSIYFLVLLAGGSACSGRAAAQGPANGLVAAEKDFARLSRTSTTHEAFVKNLDSNAIVFTEKGPVKGLPLWQAGKADSSKLFWWPEYAETDASGTYGYTSGGWEWRKTSADTPAAYGHYNSLWKKDAAGNWKVWVDCGTDCGKYSHDASPALDVVKVAGEPAEDFDEHKLFQLEEDFLRVFSTDRAAAYKQYLSKVSRLDRSGQQPLHDQRGNYTSCVKVLPDEMTMQPIGSVLSPGRDLCLVYGSILSHGVRDTYMRIWRHESQGWKIALEVLRLP